MKPDFKVFGDKEILKDIKINIEPIRQEEYPYNESKVVSLWYNNTLYKINEEDIFVYRIYVSYKDSLVQILEFENIYQWANDYINHIYIFKADNSLYAQYIGIESNIKAHKGNYKENYSSPSFRGSLLPLLPKKDFFEKEDIKDESDIKRLESYFFNFYSPDKQEYKRMKNKNQPSSNNTYKTFKGKEYTKQEWEIKEQELWEEYLTKNNKPTKEVQAPESFITIKDHSIYKVYKGKEYTKEEWNIFKQSKPWWWRFLDI